MLAVVFGRRIRTTFNAMAAEALLRNNQTFVELARNQFDQMRAEANEEVSRKEQTIRELIQPLEKVLERYDQQLKDLETKREQAYGSLTQYLQNVAGTQVELRRETSNLVQALRSPQVRGKWGEMSLVRVVEMAGMVEHADFQTQAALQSADARLRPDLIVRLPNERWIVVDSKVPLDSYLNALEAEDDGKRAHLLEIHTRQLKQHITSLGSKAYWDQLEESPEFVVLFVPLESLYSTALREDPMLLEKAAEKKVILATPTTLMALLKAVAYGWKQEQLAENARLIGAQAKEFLERLSVLTSHFSKLGKSLEKSVEAYNETVASLERRVLPQARRLKEIGISSDKEIDESHWIDRTTRRLDELSGGSTTSTH